MNLVVSTSQPIGSGSRLRPGERPIWWNASRDHGSFALWREEAARAGLNIDAWISLLLEFDLVLDDMPPSLQPLDLLAAAAAARPNVTALTFSPAMRSWIEPGPVTADARDELPEIALPQRIAIRLRPGSSLSSRLKPELIDLALACDRRAAVHSRTLESWALSVAVKSSTT